MQKTPKRTHQGGNPATNSQHSLAKDKVFLALLPIGEDGRGNTYTSTVLKSFVHRWQDMGSYPTPIVLTHDQDRNRPAVGWLTDFSVNSTHLMGWAHLLPEGQAAFYGTHPGWSVEVSVASDGSGIDLKSLALLGSARPYFKDLGNYSQYYSENYNMIDKKETDLEDVMEYETEEEDYEDEQPEGADETTSELLSLNDEMSKIVTNQESEIAELKKQLEASSAKQAEYEEKAINSEINQLYAELEMYGCGCEKSDLKASYVAMAAEVRPNFRSLVASIAKSGKTQANSITKGAKLLYEENNSPELVNVNGRLEVARARMNLYRLQDKV